MLIKQNTLILEYYLSMNIGDNIKQLRKINNLSQKEFACKMDTTQQRVSEWECGKVEPSLFNIIKMIKVLNTTFDDLVEGIEEK